MDQTVVTATVGRKLGTRPSRRLRAEGRLPGVVYGLGRDPVTVTVGYAELRDALKGDAGMNTMLQLEIEGLDPETVIVRDVQRDPIKRLVTHADFLRIDPDQPIRVNVPILLVGEAAAVTDNGGMIEQNLFELEVEVSPRAIPNQLEADISGMTLDTGVSVGDIVLPDGVTTVVAEEISVVSPVISRAAKMMTDEEEGEEGDGADATDGEAGDADDGGEE